LNSLGVASALVLTFGLSTAPEFATAADTVEISRQALRDKVRGGWAGQMIGVSFGFPTEFGYLNRTIPPDELPQWSPEMVHEALNQDDLYVDITLASVLDRHGLDAGSEDFAALFRDTQYPLWHANLSARRALRRGVPATLSGTPRFNMHANDIDFQIESDFIGLMTPGLPQESNRLSFTAGRVMNHGDGIYGGMFISAMYGAAFITDDPQTIVETGRAALPVDSRYAAVVGDALSLAAEYPQDWLEAWHLLTEKWSRGQACPAGALRDFNIDATVNGGYVALALLYGDGDFEKTMRLAARAGQDSDCNPASALGILGVVIGYDEIPSQFSKGIDAIAEEHFSFTTYSFNDIIESTLRRALSLIEKTGGDVGEENVRIRLQAPLPAALDDWTDYGVATERIGFRDDRWRWHGDWREDQRKVWRSEHASRISNEEGAEARISFTGTGAAVTGLLLPEGGRADIFLDAVLVATIDVYPDEEDAKTDEAIWHIFGLELIDHDLRIVVRGESFGASQGAEVSIDGLIVFE